MHSGFTDTAPVRESEPMAPAQPDATPGETSLETTIQRFLDRGQKSGNYRDGLKRVLTDWQAHLATDLAIETVEAVDKAAMAEYATRLADRVAAVQNRNTNDGITAGTAWTYYDYVSAFLSWCVKRDYLPENPARKELALYELPARPTTKSGEQQFWTTDQRRSLCQHADRRADHALDEHGLAAVEELRDRALVYVLAYSGVRGGEILADPRDERRDGLRWSDLALEDGYMTVLGKNQTEDTAQLPRQTHGPLQRLETALKPADASWPVFPTGHAPTLANGLPDEVDRREDESYLDCYRRVDETPSALTTNGGRSVLKRLCDAAEIDVDDGYLTPHGARRGVGELIYRNRGPAAAQRTLRHADPRTTSEMYAHIEASELADEVGDVFQEDEIPDGYT